MDPILQRSDDTMQTNEIRRRHAGSGRLRRRASLTLALAVVAAAVLSVCADVSRGAGKEGGTLTVATTAAIQNTLPYPLSSPTLPWRRQVFNTLVTLDEKARPLPELAVSWKVSNNYRDFVFRLRKGVRFSDGFPFTAKAAAWALIYARDPSHAAQQGRQLARSAIQVLGKYALRITFPTPMPQLFSVLTDVQMIRPSASIATDAVGTGPFKIDKLVPGQELDLSRNPYYWKKGLPKLDKLVIKTVPDPNTLALNLQSHAVDMTIGIPSNQYASLAPKFKVLRVPGPGNMDILVASDKPPLNDPRVRKALSLAFDRKRFVAVATSGLATPTCVPFPPSSPAWSKADDTCPFALSRAKALLAQAGYANGLDLTLQVPTILAPFVTFAPIYQSDLASIGVKLTIQNVELVQWIDLISNRTFPQLIAQQYTYGTLDPALLMGADPFRVGTNAQRYQSQKYAALVAKAEGTTDPAKRVAAFRAVSRFVRDQAFDIEVANPPSIFMMQKNVSGFRATAMGLPEFEATVKS
jgi:peptide/nickel transport system substrate-binding protein